MREIRFRAWDNKTNRFLKLGLSIDLDGNVFGIGFHNGYGHMYFAEGIVLTQYTGLLDKQRKEIYEGDIVIGFCAGNHPAVVECDAPNGGYNLRDMDGEYIEIFHNEDDLEVIGNIYENPELTPLH